MLLCPYCFIFTFAEWWESSAARKGDQSPQRAHTHGECHMMIKHLFVMLSWIFNKYDLKFDFIFFYWCCVTILPVLLPPPDFSFCFLCNQAIHGQGVERHMLGLKMVAIEDLTSLPEIFMDTSYAVSSHFNLYTSQVCGCSRPFTHCS